jgi:hypothetical protein
VSASAGSVVVAGRVLLVVVVVVVEGEEAAVTVEACTSVSGEFSFVLAIGVVGKVGAVAGFAWESAAGAA